jgi:molybdate transport system substrate-binding protein
MSAPEVRGLSSMATRTLLAELAAQVSAAGPTRVSFESAGGVEVAKRIRAGATADLVVLAADAIERLVHDGLLRRETVVPLFRSEVVAAIPEGSAPPPVGTVEELQAALLATRRIGYSTGPSGDALLTMVDRWGLGERLAGRLVQAPPGVPVGRLLAEGGADLGFQQRSELLGVPGVRVLGELPEGARITTIFTGAVLTAAADPQGARSVLSALGSADLDPIVLRHGLAPAR